MKPFQMANCFWQRFILFLGLSFTSVSFAQSQASITLPEPLTLQSLMALPVTISPQVQLQQAKQQQALALIGQQQSVVAFELNLVGRLGWREYANETQDNHQLALHLGKQLYDFGRQSSITKAQQQLAKAEDQSGVLNQHQYQLQLMHAFLISF